MTVGAGAGNAGAGGERDYFIGEHFVFEVGDFFARFHEIERALILRNNENNDA